MRDKSKIQSYINDFRRHLAKYLKPGIGLKCTVHPAKEPGAILEFEFAAGGANEDTFKPVESTVGHALKKIPQHAFGGNVLGFTFRGTNIILEDSRILLVKGEDVDSIWSNVAAEEDVIRIVSPSQGGRK